MPNNEKNAEPAVRDAQSTAARRRRRRHTPHGDAPAPPPPPPAPPPPASAAGFPLMGIFRQAERTWQAAGSFGTVEKAKESKRKSF